jgi:hypothetical protein
MFRIAIIGGEYHRILNAKTKKICVFNAWKQKSLKNLKNSNFSIIIVIGDRIGHSQLMRVKKYANCPIRKCNERDLDGLVDSL